MKEKKKYGQYFTIPLIADFMVGMIEHGKASKVLEPSCGKGVFLSKLEEHGFHNIDAYEIDRSLKPAFPYVRYESFVSSKMDKYDVIIGNPPYIRWKNLEPELKAELETDARWNKYFNSLCDYLYIFILKSIEQLNENGELIFICTDYWLNTTYSLPLRNFMVENGYFSEIYHFREAPLFEGVCASFIIFRYIKSNERKTTIQLYQYNDEKHTPQSSSLQDKQCFAISEIPQFQKDKRWLLTTADKQAMLEKFEKACEKQPTSLFDFHEMHKIGEVCDIGNGMVSGLDKAFNVTADVGILNNEEQRATIKVLKAKDLTLFTHKSESRYLFINRKMSEKDFQNHYPNFFLHLAKYKEPLCKRYDYGKDIPYWEFVFPRSLSLFSRKEERIFVPCKERISNKNHFRFSLAGADYMPLQDVTGIFKKQGCRESIEYLTAYLNTNYVFEWLKYNGVIKGYIVEFSEAPIARIPYRPINWDNTEETFLHNEITKYVRLYIKENNRTYLDLITDHFKRLFA